MIIDNISFSYVDSSPVFENFSLIFEKNRIYSIVGPSGCGKTTLFKILAGVLQPQKGSVSYEKDENHSIMMQADTLLPWRTVVDNIRLGHELATGKSVCDTTIEQCLSDFRLEEIKESFPAELSAGMKQRVALIQAMIPEASYLFLDEPFSNLDFDVKIHVQQSLLDNHSKTQNTIVIITHDIEDAIALSDEIVVLSAKPANVLERIPINKSVSDPAAVRSSPILAEYFQNIWSLLRKSL